jgi:hypothetical protein
MNALDGISMCSFLLDILRGQGEGAKAQAKARKQHGNAIFLELEAMKDETRKEIDRRWPVKK